MINKPDFKRLVKSIGLKKTKALIKKAKKENADIIVFTGDEEEDIRRMISSKKFVEDLKIIGRMKEKLID